MWVRANWRAALLVVDFSLWLFGVYKRCEFQIPVSLVRLARFPLQNFPVWNRSRHQVFFFTVRAPYLAWVIAGMSVLMGGGVQDHLLGIAVGHVYYFFEERMSREVIRSCDGLYHVCTYFWSTKWSSTGVGKCFNLLICSCFFRTFTQCFPHPRASDSFAHQSCWNGWPGCSTGIGKDCGSRASWNYLRKKKHFAYVWPARLEAGQHQLQKIESILFVGVQFPFLFCPLLLCRHI